MKVVTVFFVIGPYAGVPCGGIGGGCIGRGYRGDFRRWSLFPGNRLLIVLLMMC